MVKWNRAVRHAFFLICLLAFLALSLTNCGGSASSSTPTPTASAAIVNPPPKNPFQVTEVKMSVSPASLAGKRCGSSLTLTSTATFSVLEDGPGGSVHVVYTTTNGRSTTPAPLFLAYAQPSNTSPFTWRGTLSPDHVSPGLGWVIVTGPNPLTAVPIKPSGTCSSSQRSRFASKMNTFSARKGPMRDEKTKTAPGISRDGISRVCLGLLGGCPTAPATPSSPPPTRNRVDVTADVLFHLGGTDVGTYQGLGNPASAPMRLQITEQDGIRLSGACLLNAQQFPLLKAEVGTAFGGEEGPVRFTVERPASQGQQALSLEFHATVTTSGRMTGEVSASDGRTGTWSANRG